MKEQRRLLLALIPLAAVMALVSLGCQDQSARQKQLEGLSAREALDLANTWRQEAPEVTSYVTSEEIVFELPNGRKHSIEMPEDSMVVSVAPYLNETHR